MARYIIENKVTILNKNLEIMNNSTNKLTTTMNVVLHFYHDDYEVNNVDQDCKSS